MAEEQTSELQASEEVLRPVILVDAATLRDRDTFLRHCFVGLADESCKATLLCPVDAQLGQVSAAPVDIIPYPPLMSLGMWGPILSPLVEKLRRMQPTVLHCASESKLRLTVKLSKLLDVPFIISVNSPVSRTWRRYCRGRCAGIVTPSEAVAKEVRKDMGARADIVKYLKVGTFVSERTACFSTAGSLATMVMVHPLEAPKDFEAVFGAIKHLSIDGMEIVVALMGGGKAEGRTRRLITDLGLGHVINIVPDVRPLGQVFAGADIFIKPRRLKTFDFYLLDAMSEGMAVAACKGDQEDLIRPGQTAAVFEEGDELSIYSTLAGLLKERQQARRLARGAQDLLRAEYRVSRMVMEMIAIYREASEKGR
jgi:glycosyltransferase involved in cell wall biosynthesis